MVQLEEDRAILVERLLRDDGGPSGVLGQPRLQVEHHAVHEHPASARLVVLHHLRPAVHAHA
eukprot:CAMPEP_0119078690 /NCGR_PEP_ID=MMETSP1178-20130426/102345_1 /TAXON_ID=33656 /ORGANISM="unid sp, Strain CCMP2000" /LENGTH=61 /DNA_ID=CAMNT_0007061149 /DNA_START=163 /DNA_END=345 /DNA_ORIENTATION=+